MRQRGDRRMGFSLSELLVAMAILTIIMGALLMLFRSTLDAYKTSRQIMEASEETHTSFRVLERDLTNIFNSRDAGDSFNFYGTPYGMTMICMVDPGQDITARVSYVIPPNITRQDMESRNIFASEEYFRQVDTGPLIRLVEPGVETLDSFRVEWPNPNAGLPADIGQAVLYWPLRQIVDDYGPTSSAPVSAEQLETMLKSRRAELLLAMLAEREYTYYDINGNEYLIHPPTLWDYEADRLLVNGIDDDQDGMIDESDSDGIDNDSDGSIDEADEVADEAGDGVDNDRDGVIDEDGEGVFEADGTHDSWGAISATYGGFWKDRVAEDYIIASGLALDIGDRWLTNGRDDDGDGSIDEADEIGDGIDNDNDGMIDEAGVEDAFLIDGIDNDGDGDVDEPDEAGDGIDNDGDGDTDEVGEGYGESEANRTYHTRFEYGGIVNDSTVGGMVWTGYWHSLEPGNIGWPGDEDHPHHQYYGSPLYPFPPAMVKVRGVFAFKALESGSNPHERQFEFIFDVPVAHLRPEGLRDQ